MLCYFISSSTIWRNETKALHIVYLIINLYFWGSAKAHSHTSFPKQNVFSTFLPRTYVRSNFFKFKATSKSFENPSGLKELYTSDILFDPSSQALKGAVLSANKQKDIRKGSHHNMSVFVRL